MVEVSGVEPESMKRSTIASTCVANPIKSLSLMNPIKAGLIKPSLHIFPEKGGIHFLYQGTLLFIFRGGNPKDILRQLSASGSSGKARYFSELKSEGRAQLNAFFIGSCCLI